MEIKKLVKLELLKSIEQQFSQNGKSHTSSNHKAKEAFQVLNIDVVKGVLQMNIISNSQMFL